MSHLVLRQVRLGRMRFPLKTNSSISLLNCFNRIYNLLHSQRMSESYTNCVPCIQANRALILHSQTQAPIRPTFATILCNNACILSGGQAAIPLEMAWCSSDAFLICSLFTCCLIALPDQLKDVLHRIKIRHIRHGVLQGDR